MEKEERKLTWKEFWTMLGPAFKGSRAKYALVLIFVLLAAVAQVAEPIIFGRIIDEMFQGSEDLFDRLTPYLLAWVGAFFVSIIAGQLGQWLSWVNGVIVANRFLNQATQRVMAWDPEKFGQESSGAISKRINRAWDRTFDVAGRALTDVLPTLVMFIVVSIGGVLLDWRMTIAALVTVPFAVVLSIKTYTMAEKKQDKLEKSWEDLASQMQEMLSNILPIKIFTGESRVMHQLEVQADDVAHRQNTLNGIWSLLGAGNGIVRLAARLMLIIVGAVFIADGSLSVGDLIAFLGMLTYILAPFDYLLADVMRRASEVRSAFARLSKDWFEKNKLLESPRAKRLRHVQGEIHFDDVTYRYPEKKKDALSAISLLIPAGTSLAIVGKSGGGKSTLVRFINRFIDPTKGSVMIDGHDLRDIKIEDVRKSVGVVQQDTVLFNDTVLNNIKFAAPGASKKEVIAACKKAQAHEFILRLPKGYDTIVGERGVKLSGGERQRISLARVFLASPPILILDESTSALDSETEHLLQEALKEAMRDRTTIIIAHRLSTVFMCDQIIVLDEGKIAEKGSHKQLLDEGGVYNRLWKLQSGGYLPE